MPIDDRNRNSRTELVINATGENDDEFGAVVVTAIADELEIDPAAMPPLRESVDPDMLEALRHSDPPSTNALSFEYLGYDIVVTSDGIIELRPFP